MKRQTFLRFVLGSVLCGLLMGAVMWSVVGAVDHRNHVEFSDGMRRFVARVLEKDTPQKAMDTLSEYRKGISFFSSSMWLVNDQNQILARNTPNPPPKDWESLPRPATPHAYEPRGSVYILRLNTPTPLYLINQRHDPPLFKKNTGLKVLVGFVAFTVAGMGALFFLFLYLRSKSWEAQKVLRRLEKGDLKARFPIQRLDEVGNLMHDFNRMADEIERLVGRVHEAQNSRRVLIQELGHDLRTPLTTLRTSLDGLATDWRVMSEKDRGAILGACQTEVSYLSELVEGLLFISQMEEPRYRRQIASLDLVELIDTQVRTAQASSRYPHLLWDLKMPQTDRATVCGDPSLLQRMVRNLLENAAHFARRRVQIRLKPGRQGYHLEIEDDGPGMTPEQVRDYGKRAAMTFRKTPTEGKVSLGLGSVIVTRVVDLHQGRLRVRVRREPKPATVVQVTLPKNGGEIQNFLSVP